jgi:hypothetical protein
VIGVADLAPFQRVVAHVERDALLLQTVDLRGHVHVGISVLHVPRFLEVFGLQEKRQSVAVENDLEVQVVLADGVDVILDVAQCAGLGFRVMPIPSDPVWRLKSSGHQHVDDIGACSRDNTSAR